MYFSFKDVQSVMTFHLAIVLTQFYFNCILKHLSGVWCITQKSVHSVSTGTINVPDPYGWRRADLKVSLYTFKTIVIKLINHKVKIIPEAFSRLVSIVFSYDKHLYTNTAVILH